MQIFTRCSVWRRLVKLEVTNRAIFSGGIHTVGHYNTEEQTTDQCKTTGGETKCETEEIIDHMTETPSLKYNQLRKITKNLKSRTELKNAAAEQGIENELYTDVLHKFCKFIHDLRNTKSKGTPALHATLYNIHQGTTHVDSLFPHLIEYAQRLHPLLLVMPELKKISNLTSPAQWYPGARCMRRHFIIHAGPTNSGKTHSALKAFFSANNGVYCSPLRMLAAEICQKSIAADVPCDLITGEERVYASGNSEELAQHIACTIEMLTTDIGTQFDVAVIDEAQMVRDQERGGAWTRAILGIAAKEIHLCGEATMIPIMQYITSLTGDTLEIKYYDRLTPLVTLPYSLNGRYSSVSPGDCIVAFSRKTVFYIKQQVEKATGHPCGVIYGALPSANRLQQAAMFNAQQNSPEVKIIVATDAIGMGMNLNIKRIVFYTLRKKEGQSIKDLASYHAKQIAGRAGRYGKDYRQGEVTTFYPEDLSLLHELLGAPIENIEKAGITPVFEQIQLFSNCLPGLKFHDLLEIFKKTTRLDSKFFLCKKAFDDWIEVSKTISESNLDLSLKDTYTFSLAPVKFSNPLVKEVFCKYVMYYSSNTPLEFPELCKLLGWPLPSPIDTTTLLKWEDVHNSLDLYLWLNQRYPDHFPDDTEVRDTQRAIEKTIRKCLSKKYLAQEVLENVPTSFLGKTKTNRFEKRVVGSRLSKKETSGQWKKKVVGSQKKDTDTVQLEEDIPPIMPLIDDQNKTLEPESNQVSSFLKDYF